MGEGNKQNRIECVIEERGNVVSLQPTASPFVFLLLFVFLMSYQVSSLPICPYAISLPSVHVPTACFVSSKHPQANACGPVSGATSGQRTHSMTLHQAPILPSRDLCLRLASQETAGFSRVPLDQTVVY